MARGAPRLTQGLSVSSWSVASVAAAPATELSVVTEMALTNQKYLQEQTAMVIIGVNKQGGGGGLCEERPRKGWRRKGQQRAMKKITKVAVQQGDK